MFDPVNQHFCEGDASLPTIYMYRLHQYPNSRTFRWSTPSWQMSARKKNTSVHWRGWTGLEKIKQLMLGEHEIKKK